ncbi:hypothetical protein [Lentilactobacillus kosonis]|uniref:Uncharacterized protein n=1 Tax=Lentilactobacillus kosonis TaxID=2810561 RepID=A0A401FMB7_9LACO|nr:hypothetical protein [Lentilactobacillus kosonis]GAY73466.1 hypothetical protein NBRC111893_1612 [Lentilactobacillus kosonis]
MEVDVPLTMAEVAQKVQELNANGQNVTEDDVIRDTILQSFQGYLDEAEEGHYDSARYDYELEVATVTGRVTHTIKPMTGNSLIEDFKQNPDMLFMYLSNRAEEIAKE